MTLENTNPEFISGLDLAAAFFQEAVSPILERHMPDIEYTAALIGSGSEVLGFDDSMSRDHHWGPRVMLFLRQPVLKTREGEISELLAENLPRVFRGYPTNWNEPDPKDTGSQHLSNVEEGPINHRVEMFTVGGFFDEYMGIDVGKPLGAADWLTLPWQKLRSICAGRIFRDDLDLAAICENLSWYPDDVWLYLLASCWSRIGEEEHLMGRAGLVGSEIGSSIIASRLVRDIMRLAFLMERIYPPYPKWFGKAFAELECAATLQPILGDVLNAPSWKERDAALTPAYRHIAEMHNALGITSSLSSEPYSFWGRPFTVIHGDRFADALRNVIQDQAVKSIAERRLIGNIDLVSDNTDLLEDPTRRQALLALYKPEG
ncbi:DUF4037 domain-containing protein [Candidatus Hydrogenedentota bacterium]